MDSYKQYVFKSIKTYKRFVDILQINKDIFKIIGERFNQLNNKYLKKNFFKKRKLNYQKFTR